MQPLLMLCTFTFFPLLGLTEYTACESTVHTEKYKIFRRLCLSISLFLIKAGLSACTPTKVQSHYLYCACDDSLCASDEAPGKFSEKGNCTSKILIFSKTLDFSTKISKIILYASISQITKYLVDFFLKPLKSRILNSFSLIDL